MKIAFLAWQGSIHTQRWVEFFARRGHDVHVITCGDGGSWADADLATESERPPYPVHDVGAPRFGKLGYFAKILAVRRIVKNINPDVVHAHFVTSYGMLGLACGIRPLIVTAHGDDVLITPHQSRITKWIVTRVLQTASIITVPSEVMRSAVIDLVGSDQTHAGFPVAVFQYGVEATRLAERGASIRALRDVATADSPTLRIVSTRAFLDLYRIGLLIDALAIIAARDVPFHCDLIGDGSLAATLRAQVKRAGLSEHVEFHGHLPPWEVEAIVAAGDLYVSIAESDGVSLSLLEAMALGTVPVLSDIAANRLWIEDGVTGVLVGEEVSEVAEGLLRARNLNREVVVSANLNAVLARADRATNLGACELLIDELVGVVWDPR